MSDKIKRIKELVPLLSNAARIYEQENREIMSNKEYDKLYDELALLEKETGVVLANSVTRKVGYEVVSNLPKVRHTSRILSLDKTKEVNKLVNFLGDDIGILSWKLDGITIVITYDNGKLVQAITRGNGEIGEDITNNAKTFVNLPLNIEHKGNLVIRGEAIIKYSDFEKINSYLPEDEKYKNPRNLCSGSVRQLNSQITANRNVHFYGFTVVDGGIETDSKIQQLEWLDKQGFEVVEYSKVTSDTIPETVEWFSANITKRDFASDGLVLTLDSISKSKELGNTAKFPRDSIAFKWADEVQETTLNEIIWNTSRTGSINPIAVFEPVELEGTTVSRASLHNISILKDLKLGIGDTIRVYKANMIIPQVESNITKSDNVKIPQKCPVCLGETRIIEIKEAKVLHCTNPTCEAKRLKSLVHFVSRDAMNIQGFSEASIEKFMENGFIHDFVDIFKLDRYKDDIQNLKGFGKKSYENIIKSVEASRTVNLANFIYSLGIEQIGINNAKIISNHFNNNLEDIMLADEDELVKIDGIGEIMAHNIKSYFDMESNKKLIEELLKEIKILVPEKEETTINEKVYNKTFVVTGKVYEFKNRRELSQKIEDLGGKVVGSVSNNTDYLINNDKESTSSKNKRAKELNIPIISEKEFINMYN